MRTRVLVRVRTRARGVCACARVDVRVVMHAHTCAGEWVRPGFKSQSSPSLPLQLTVKAPVWSFLARLSTTIARRVDRFVKCMDEHVCSTPAGCLVCNLVCIRARAANWCLVETICGAVCG